MTDTNSPIHRDPEVLGGTVVFSGTRVPLETLLDYFKGGESLAEFLRDFPSVTKEQAGAAIDLLVQEVERRATAA
jgi:uncharacterized protein (DUF433 family)